MSVLDLEKFVREVCKIVHRIAAIATSAAAAKTFMQDDSPLISASWRKLVKWILDDHGLERTQDVVIS